MGESLLTIPPEQSTFPRVSEKVTRKGDTTIRSLGRDAGPLWGGWCRSCLFFRGGGKGVEGLGSSSHGRAGFSPGWEPPRPELPHVHGAEGQASLCPGGHSCPRRLGAEAQQHVLCSEICSAGAGRRLPVRLSLSPLGNDLSGQWLHVDTSWATRCNKKGQLQGTRAGGPAGTG